MGNEIMTANLVICAPFVVFVLQYKIYKIVPSQTVLQAVNQCHNQEGTERKQLIQWINSAKRQTAGVAMR